MRAIPAVLLGSLLAAWVWAGTPLCSNSYKGQEPPELVAAPEHWINTKEPVTLKGLKGKVVWLEFGFIH